jgi:uncharacterized membrane protein
MATAATETGNVNPAGADFVYRREEEVRKSAAEGTNVGLLERIASGVVGGILIGVGLRRRGIDGIALAAGGAYLAARGVTGHCQLYRTLGISTHGPAPAYKREEGSPGLAPLEGLRTEESIVIDRPAEDLYSFWRKYENLAGFMPHIESVTSTDGINSHWVAKAPLGTTVEWDARIHTDDPWRMFSWTSTQGEVATAGSVHFKPMPGHQSTEVRLNMKFDPPLGKVGVGLAEVFGMGPDQFARETLKRLKQMMETGEMSTGGRNPTIAADRAE